MDGQLRDLELESSGEEGEGEGGEGPGRSVLSSVCVLPSVFRIHRIHVFFGLPDPDPLVRGMDPDPDPSIIMQK